MTRWTTPLRPWLGAGRLTVDARLPIGFFCRNELDRDVMGMKVRIQLAKSSIPGSSETT